MVTTEDVEKELEELKKKIHQAEEHGADSGFGVHLEKESRFLKLKKSHPKVYDYCIGGGMHNEDGIWIPSNDGLGLGHVFDKLNELYSTPYKKFIDY